VYSGVVARRLADGVRSSTASLTTGVTNYSAAAAVNVSSCSARQQLIMPLSSSPQSSAMTTGATCHWTHQQQQQPAFSMLDDNMTDFALMASLVSTSSCDDVLLKGP